MQNAPITGVADPLNADGNRESATSAVSWAAIVAGAFVTAAASLVLFSLGAGLGFAIMPSASAPPREGATIALTCAAAIWLIVVQWLSSGLGGYLTGRLRTKWVGVHTHEIFFRDTVHGFLTWAVATIVVVLFFTSAASSIMHHPHPAAPPTPGADNGPMAYYVENLYRPIGGHPASLDEGTRSESEHILAMGMAQRSLSDTDKAYLSQLVADHTGVTTSDAETRIDNTLTQMKSVEDKAQDAIAAISIYTSLAMLVGAFIASVAAALGGYERDKHYAVVPAV